MITSLQQPVIIGKTGSTYGVRGWLKILSFTEEADRIFDYQPWFIQHNDHWQPVDIQDWKHHQTHFLIKIKNIDQKESAQQLVNRQITVEASQLPTLDEGEYYWRDLIGCEVITVSGDLIGTVTSMMATNANDVMVVKMRLQDKKESLIPFLYGQVVKKVDRVMQQIEVNWDPDF